MVYGDREGGGGGIGRPLRRNTYYKCPDVLRRVDHTKCLSMRFMEVLFPVWNDLETCRT